MIYLTEQLDSQGPHDDMLVLPFERRQKSRLRVNLESGRVAGLFLPRGTVLRGGDRLKAQDGTLVRVVAAEESVIMVTSDQPIQLTRAAYHLGNRHVPLEIGDGWLKLEMDHVLQDMLVGMGLQVDMKQSAFEPESGAYGGGHRHAHEQQETTSIRAPHKQRGSHD